MAVVMLEEEGREEKGFREEFSPCHEKNYNSMLASASVGQLAQRELLTDQRQSRVALVFDLASGGKPLKQSRSPRYVVVSSSSSSSPSLSFGP